MVSNSMSLTSMTLVYVKCIQYTNPIFDLSMQLSCENKGQKTFLLFEIDM